MDCKYHPGHEAELTCIQCGQQFCRECVREKKATHYCPECHQAELDRFSQKLGITEAAPKVKKEKVPKQKVAKEKPPEEAAPPPVEKEKKSRQLRRPKETPSAVPPLATPEMAAPPPPVPSITPEEKADFWGDIQEPKRRRRGREQQLPPPPSFEPVPVEEEHALPDVAAFEQVAPPPASPTPLVQQPAPPESVQQAPVAQAPVPPAPVAPAPVRVEPVRPEPVPRQPVPPAPVERPPLQAPPLPSAAATRQRAPIEPSKTVEPLTADTMVPLTRPEGSHSIQKPKEREKAVMTAEGFPVGGGSAAEQPVTTEEGEDEEIFDRRIKRKKSRGPKSKAGDGLLAMQIPDEYNGEVTVHPAYLKALLWGLLAGLIGGGAYAAVAWWRHGEQGILGWLIGLAVGLTVVFASGRHFNWKLGLMSALIAVFFLSAGRIFIYMLTIWFPDLPIHLPFSTMHNLSESFTQFLKQFGTLKWLLIFFITGGVAFLVSFRPWPIKVQMSNQAPSTGVAKRRA
jgi:hypothetical protein